MNLTAVTERRPLGNTGLSVSPLCFGTSALADMPDTYGYGVDEARARATLQAIFDGPVGFLDTSRNYGLGRSESRIGDAIRERGGLPDGFVVSTKIDRDMQTLRFDAARARQSLEESLTALGLERVQILHLHDPEYAADLTEVTRADGALAELFRMRDEGLAVAVGLAAGRVDVMMPLLATWDFDVLITHNRYTIINRQAEAMMEFARSRNIAILNAAPYAGGALAKGSAAHPMLTYQRVDAAALEPVQAVERLCAEHGVPIGAVALQFSMRDERILSTICGVSKPERVAQTIEWAKWPIPEALWEAVMALPYSEGDPEASREYKAE